MAPISRLFQFRLPVTRLTRAERKREYAKKGRIESCKKERLFREKERMTARRLCRTRGVRAHSKERKRGNAGKQEQSKVEREKARERKRRFFRILLSRSQSECALRVNPLCDYWEFVRGSRRSLLLSNFTGYGEGSSRVRREVCVADCKTTWLIKVSSE